MGLDMFLHRRIFVWSEDRKNLKIQLAKTPIKGEKVDYIVEEAGYWRKANAIHKWFVDNVQKGNDNCGEYYVDENQMLELLVTIKKVIEASELVDGDVVNGYSFKDGKKTPIIGKGKTIKDPTVAQTLLPTTEGFFFGGTEYDQYYIDDLRQTQQILEECLKDKRGDYYYSSSW